MRLSNNADNGSVHSHFGDYVNPTMLLEELGVRQIINAHGTLTVLGGSILDDEVLDSIREASKVYLDVPRLHEKAGKYIANLIHAEAAYVTAGGGAALALSVAPCMTR